MSRVPLKHTFAGYCSTYPTSYGQNPCMAAYYDFQNLSFDDFERLCADLMQVRIGVPLESFRVGRDGGIDLRYAPSKDHATIIQCKRYASDAFARLYRDLESKELAKVRALASRRYVLCTSCKLSPPQKDKLLRLLAPHCQSSGDIFGADELNRIVAANPDIERRHFKLWLGSTAVLERVLNAGIFSYSEHEVEMLQREISRYVVHEGFDRALRILDETHHCIIVGIPGVGKTTAARLLLAHYLREGYDVISVTRDVDEAWRVLSRSADAKQVVYYDDFLGQVTFSQKLEKNEDRRLLELMTHCKNSRNKRFILTTRDYILDQAVGAHEPLDRAKVNLKLSTVTLDDYSPIVRARLLANHLQFSNIGLNVLQAVVDTRAYATIIEHPNFLPRVVEQLCSDSEIEGKTPQQFIDNAVAVLNDPSRVWQRPFRQLTVDARHLAYTLASCNGTCEYERLETGWRSLNIQLGHRSDRSFVDVLREVEGSFTQSQKYPGFGSSTKREGRMVRFVNPSVREFVMADLLNHDELLMAVFESAVSFTQLLFWREARYSLSGKSSISVAAKYARAISTKAPQLLSVVEPRLEIYSGKQTIFWNLDARKFNRLHALFQALSEMGHPSQLRSVCLVVFGHDLRKFAEMMPGQELTWLPEVLKVVLDLYKSDDPEMATAACQTLEVDRWDRYARDFLDVRYLWVAAGWAIELAPDAGDWHDRTRDALIAKTKELCSDVPDDWSADELVDASDELELLMNDLEAQLEQEVEKLRARAGELEQAEEERDEYQASLSARYGRDSGGDQPSAVDGVFRTLVEQLDRFNCV